MKAVIFSEHGGPEVLRYTDVPEPAIGARDVLVRVRACALNHLDLWIRRGLPGRNVPLPHIPGSDISGEVAKIGAEVTNVRVGEQDLACAGSFLRTVRAVHRRPRQFLQGIRALRLDDSGRLRGIRAVAVGQRDSDPRQSHVRGSRRDSARISDRLAHAFHAARSCGRRKKCW